MQTEPVDLSVKVEKRSYGDSSPEPLTLNSHPGLEYRVPIKQGMSLFWSLFILKMESQHRT